ncbi:DUF5960 family protein [Enterococcus mundtii]|nr:DUF5960 family protein [Enterococcus mundtii]
MRNKEKFITDYNEVVKPELQNNETLVEDAAHTLNHSTEPVYTVPAEFTATNKEENFIFEQKEREKQMIQTRAYLTGFILEEVINNDYSFKWRRTRRTTKWKQLDGSGGSWQW